VTCKYLPDYKPFIDSDIDNYRQHVLTGWWHFPPKISRGCCKFD